MGTENALQAPHQLQLDSRSRLHMTGVIEVESFDEATIVLTTTRALPVPFPGSLCPHLDSHVIVINRHFRKFQLDRTFYCSHRS